MLIHKNASFSVLEMSKQKSVLSFVRFETWVILLILMINVMPGMILMINVMPDMILLINMNFKETFGNAQ